MNAIRPEVLDMSHKDANQIILEGSEIRRRIAEIRSRQDAVRQTVSQEMDTERKTAELEIISSLEILSQTQKILVTRTDLDEESFAKELDTFVSNYSKVISYLAHKYGMPLVDELIRKQQESVTAAEV